MKNYISGILLLPLLTIACSENEFQEDGLNKPHQQFKSMSENIVFPLNPYESIGGMQEECAAAYEASDFKHSTILEVSRAVDSIVNARLATPSGNVVTYQSQIATIIDSEEVAVSLVSDASSLSITARSALVNFITNQVAHKSETTNNLIALIDAFEQSVSSNPLYSLHDKQALYTTASLERYTLGRKRRKDKDWETSVANVAAMAYGSAQNELLGLKISLVVELCLDKGIYQ
jgi:hypothetical protein